MYDMEGFKIFAPIFGLIHFTSTNREIKEKVVKGTYKYDVEYQLLQFWNNSKKNADMRRKIIKFGLYETAMRNLGPSYRN